MTFSNQAMATKLALHVVSSTHRMEPCFKTKELQGLHTTTDGGALFAQGTKWRSNVFSTTLRIQRPTLGLQPWRFGY